MPTYNTPGVYVEEISTLPPSVAQVATAIPAFVGHTEKVPTNKATRISSMLEFETLFGGPMKSAFSASVTPNTETGISAINALVRTSTDNFILYYCMKLFFANGGGSCYVVSAGDYSITPEQAKFSAALAEVAKVDEPTLLVLADALGLGATAYYLLCQEAMAQCATLKDRFTILDVFADDDPGIEVFRNAISSNLSYGAAYTPRLVSAIAYAYDENLVEVTINPEPTKWGIKITLDGGGIINANFDGDSKVSPKPKIKLEFDAAATPAISFPPVSGNVLTIKLRPFVAGNSTATPATVDSGTMLEDIQDVWENHVSNSQKGKFSLHFSGNKTAFIKTVPTTEQSLDEPPSSFTSLLTTLKNTQTGIYNLVKARLATNYITLPPSAAMAGIYSRVDGARGVWKAPANEAVSAVLRPSRIIADEEQGRLNVDPTSGKSINAIRSFTGKGTLVWGARTLAGNDNEWRYVSVRRLFITIEESVQKASAFAVFEPNDATTWLKVKAMIDNYLYGLWQQGALAGPSPESSYYVHVGLGKTMTTQDILEGRLIVEIGVAAVRPAEFIVLRFSHKLQEA